jgi:hypothetical protein
LELMEASVADPTARVPIANNSTALKKVHILNRGLQAFPPRCQIFFATSNLFFFFSLPKRSHKKRVFLALAVLIQNKNNDKQLFFPRPTARSRMYM